MNQSGLRVTIGLLILAVTSCATCFAAEYKPGFTCPRFDVLASYICEDQAMARAELTLEKSYYGHRQQDGVQSYHDLKMQAVTFDTALRSACGIPASGKPGVMPMTGPACYVRQVEGQVQFWNKTLHDSALDEGSRDIDVHIAAQQKLIDLGYLPTTSTADGIYGAGTRNAIVSWQQKQGLATTGFLNNVEVMALLSSVRTTTEAATSVTPATEAAAHEPAAPTNVTTDPTSSEGLAKQEPRQAARFLRFRAKAMNPNDRTAALLNYTTYGSDIGSADAFWAKKNWSGSVYVEYKEGPTLAEPVVSAREIDTSKIDASQFFVRNSDNGVAVIIDGAFFAQCTICNRKVLQSRWIDYFTNYPK